MTVRRDTSQRVPRGGEPAFVFLAAIVILAATSVSPAVAHESETVNGYELTFGGADEPVITGERMWLELEIVDAETGEPVTEQADSLNISIQRSGGQKVPWNVSEKHGEPGVYEMAVIFEEPGAYIIHVEGAVEGTELHTHFRTEVQDHTELLYMETNVSAEETEAGAETEEDGSLLSARFVAGFVAVTSVLVTVVRVLQGRW